VTIPIKIAGVSNIGLLRDEDEPSLAERSAEFARLKAEALAHEAEHGPDTAFKPGEWGIDDV
jgi:hypothetical protein